MPIVKSKFINHIAAGETIQDIFLLAEKNLVQKRDGGSFLTITLADRTGQIRGVVWDHLEKAVAKVGDFVQVQAAANEYRGALQLVIKALSPVPMQEVNAADFLPVTSRDVEQMFARLRTLTDTITAPFLKALMNAFWGDGEFVRMFKRAPAAKKMHHAYLGGLLEHSLSMALLVDKIAGHYSGVDRDLLLVGAVLHDVGKLREFCYDHVIDYTDEGRLLSHIVIGVEMVDAKARTIEGFPSGLSAMIKHMIVSHHGLREFGSPEPPKTIEAVMLNHIDEIDARVNAIREFMATEDPEAAWTSFHRLMERQFFRGPCNP
jgi:3'-5' exoribonuclease